MSENTEDDGAIEIATTGYEIENKKELETSTVYHRKGKILTTEFVNLYKKHRNGSHLLTELPWKVCGEELHEKIKLFCNDTTSQDLDVHEVECKRIPFWICYFAVLGVATESCLSNEYKPSTITTTATVRGILDPVKIQDDEYYNKFRMDFVFYLFLAIALLSLGILIVYTYSFWNVARYKSKYTIPCEQ